MSLSLSRSRASLAASEVLSLASAVVRRNGESGVMIWLERVGLNRSGVTVWAAQAGGAPDRVMQHGKSAESSRAPRLALLDPPPRQNWLPQQLHRLPRRVPSLAENVVNGVKTIMVNERLRAGRLRRLTGSAVLRGEPWARPPPRIRHGQSKTADGKIIRHQSG